MGNTWIGLLPLELDNISVDQYIEPNEDMQVTDKEIGIMPESVRKLYTLARMMEYDAGMKVLDARISNDQELKADLDSKRFESSCKCKLLMDLMWIDLRDEFHTWDNPNIGIRRGYKVVLSQPPQNPFMGLFGGLGQ